MSTSAAAQREVARHARITLRQLMAVIALIAVVAACLVDPLISLFFLVPAHVLFPGRLFWRAVTTPGAQTRSNDLTRHLASAIGSVVLTSLALLSVFFALGWMPALRSIENAATFIYALVLLVAYGDIALVSVLSLVWCVLMIRKHL